MRNRAHLGESREKRLGRFQNGPPMESIETLLNSIDNYFNNEIRATTALKPPQTSLLFLGIHAAILTVSEVFYDDKSVRGYKLFLETFVDGHENDKKFSLIANLIHSWRNVLAHQWLGSIGHELGYDYSMGRGWERRRGILFINPKTYQDQYLNAFSSGGSIWEYDQIFSN